MFRCAVPFPQTNNCTPLDSAPPPAPHRRPFCQGCGTTNRNDLTQTADRSHMVCKCGIVCAPVRISQDREKNCAREDDKTIHADKPYQPKTDRFDHPAKSCEELRKDREREAQVTRIGKKAKQKMGIGWAHEHAAREAARAERSRQEMEPKDQTKGHHIQIELEKLFTQFEPIDAPIKRFCRMAADRAWRRAVAHSKVCNARGRCQLRVKEKGSAVIADAVLSCSLNTLINDRVPLMAFSARLLCLADKIGALQNTKGTSCALRARPYRRGHPLSQNIGDPIEPCPMPSCHTSCQPSPAPSSSSDASAQQPLPSGHPPSSAPTPASATWEIPPTNFCSSAIPSTKYSRRWAPRCQTACARPRCAPSKTLYFVRRWRWLEKKTPTSEASRRMASPTYYWLPLPCKQSNKLVFCTRRVPPRLLSDFASSTAQLDAAAHRSGRCSRRPQRLSGSRRRRWPLLVRLHDRSPSRMHTKGKRGRVSLSVCR